MIEKWVITLSGLHPDSVIPYSKLYEGGGPKANTIFAEHPYQPIILTPSLNHNIGRNTVTLSTKQHTGNQTSMGLDEQLAS